MNLEEVLKEFWKSWNSKIGVSFLTMIIILSIYVAVTYPWDFGLRVWNNPSYWADNPKAVPPDWTRYFVNEKIPPNLVYDFDKPTFIEFSRGMKTMNYVAEIDYSYDLPPSFISITIRNVTYYTSKPPTLEIIFERPDDLSETLTTLIIKPPRTGETPPYRKYVESPSKIFLSGDPQVLSVMANAIENRYGVRLSLDEAARIGLEKLMFGKPVGNEFGILTGTYRLIMKVKCFDQRDDVENVKMVIGGRVYGLLGTDTLGRDLAIGLMFGFPIALIIGIVSSLLTTMIGSMMGIVSGYMGGKIDMGIQRLCDILVNIPLLPILIFFTSILGSSAPKLIIILAVLIAFSWPGLAIVIRPMILQIKSGEFIEATIALGASKRRIIFKHIFPQVAPFIFAQMIFFTPSAILAEAALSFLGLGDPSIPTWGQILEYGFRCGALYLGYWWWVLPPGLLIVFSAITFVLIALGLEPVISPRLRRR